MGKGQETRSDKDLVSLVYNPRAFWGQTPGGLVP